MFFLILHQSLLLINAIIISVEIITIVSAIFFLLLLLSLPIQHLLVQSQQYRNIRRETCSKLTKNPLFSNISIVEQVNVS